ncbi:MAG: hypothetical protein MI754_01605 [Chromatiales bacterium]|nr:hypothetical protein [Chromatiales bacterium]
MNKENFEQFFRGFHFVDCAVRSRSIIYLLGRQEYELEEGEEDPDEADVIKRLTNILLDNPESQRYGYSDLVGFRITNIEASQIPKPQVVAADYSAGVYVMGSGDDHLETQQVPYDDEKGPQRGGMIKLRNIDGYVYTAGGRRSICRREGPNHWVPLWKNMPLPKVKRRVDFEDYGFEDIDGFDHDDLYAVGGHGDVWHYDGSLWKQVPFPSNMTLRNVCCGGDGQVYIGAQNGNVFRGRGNKWKHIHDGGLSLYFTDMVWFQDKVWCTSDYGLWTIENDKLERAAVPDWVGSCAGNLSAGDGILVVAGMYGAAMPQWHRLGVAGRHAGALSTVRGIIVLGICDR